MKTLNFIVILLAASATLPAQVGNNENGDKPIRPYLALGMTIPDGDAQTLTQNGGFDVNSWSAEAGVEFFSPIAGIRLRPNAGVAKLWGAEKPDAWPYQTYKMMAWYFGFDLVYKNPKGWPVSLSTGPSFHVWNVEEAHTLASKGYGPQDLRLGWRGAVIYDVTDQWGVELSYSMSEWRTFNTAPNAAYQPGLNPSRPVWFTLKGSYKF
jgi:hypothetical protein